MATSRRAQLQAVALELFAEHGYDNVSVAQIARAAGVSHMTFFRHFPTKEAVVVGDLFDPVIAAAVSASTEATPLARVVDGFVRALGAPEVETELASEAFARRIHIASASPSLRGAVRASTAATEEAVTRALADTATPGPADRAAAGAVLGAATALLLAWADDPGDRSATETLVDGLTSLLGRSA